jgi:hypothetical protein
MNITTNIPLYSESIDYLKDRQPKTLIVWGRNDPIILPRPFPTGPARDAVCGRLRKRASDESLAFPVTDLVKIRPSGLLVANHLLFARHQLTTESSSCLHHLPLAICGVCSPIFAE